ncbi:Dimethyl sulfoxide reductase DmsA precursor [Slackia heliotrinireducens]|uniref:Anaerobic dehydrogenase, typically selenocysteine-containing n=1 Tax=Slackia heliotrinireducens (strain ATCC 29202 / DSM 20476 / NCTC 11029 / RHS 1) TaxID=471855 RepID=C7N418_SLAHD|nr:molybdopterin-dependent oxidoreductase [Slackia heliotrinireducens]ACV23754.1 anaerobic dehydrogenase, typically selenocysteine-containing [Slackia heliotrinireducens DSM 20476]VEH03375.1 Dimethyl sulfoxide reductase DmsA precursor [Slackia heliotrinireducens]
MGIIDHPMDRRKFLRAGAIAGVAAAGLAGCTPEAGTPDGGSTDSKSSANGDVQATVCENDQAIIDGLGEWKCGLCWANSSCGGYCVNYRYVVDGVVVRSGTDNGHEDTEETPQWRACPRGRSKSQNVYGAERLRYPLKRKNWQPGGVDYHPELRGKDEWERITWEEAIELAGGEIKRIYDNFGPESVLLTSYYVVPSLFGKLGGYWSWEDTVSYGSYTATCETLGLGYYGEPGLPAMNDRLDLKNAEYIVMASGNPAWAATGNPLYYLQLARDNGTQFAYIGPSYNVSASALDAKWIPVRNGTDTALWLAVAYEMIRMDEETGDIIDWDFLNTYTLGFDMNHMPEDAKLEECFKDYILGEYDDLPKTPEWATEICGTPVEDITWLADVMSKKYKTMLLHSFAAFRTTGSENLSQAMMTVALMGGHAGKSGHCFGPGLYAQFAANGGEHLVRFGKYDYIWSDDPFSASALIPGIKGWTAVADGHFTSYSNSNLAGTTSDFHAAEEHDLDIRLWYSCANNSLHTKGNGQLEGVRAVREGNIECIIAQDLLVTDTVMFSDIILPATTPWEGNLDPAEGDVMWVGNTTAIDGDLNGDHNKEIFPAIHPIIKPLFDTKSDGWIWRKLTEAVGVAVEDIFPVSEVQFWFDLTADATFCNENGEWQHIFNVTQETIDKYGVDYQVQTDGVMDLEEFFKQGYFSVDRKLENDPHLFIKFKDFIDDPEANPLTTATGKFEIYSQSKADGYNTTGLSEEPIKPYANYFTPNNGYVASFKNWETKEPGDYPFVLSQPHYLRRAHTQNDGSTWLREALQNPFFVSRPDADAKGIKTGDTVRVWNEYGQILRQASVLSSLVPGCVALPHGAHFDLDESDPDNPIDLGGSEAMLLGPKVSNYHYALSGYNSTLVNFEKYDGDPIPHDGERMVAHIDFDQFDAE